jgi:hypothetical protein
MLTTKMHFEELWEKCEELHQQASDVNIPIEILMEELLMKINLYKAVDSKTEIPEDDRQKIKSRTLGEILLTLTHLSLKDKINVFEALGIALQYRSTTYFAQKYHSTT